MIICIYRSPLPYLAVHIFLFPTLGMQRFRKYFAISEFSVLFKIVGIKGLQEDR
jgi:hypothetical protein